MTITIKSNHWVDEATGAYTKKMGGVIKPRMIVLHYTAGWTYAGDVATLSTSSRRVSAHFVIGRLEGQLTQIVPLNRRGWHAGPSKHKPSGLSGINGYSIGIEVANHGYVQDLGNGTYKDWTGKNLRSPPPGGEAVDFELWEKHPHWVLGATASRRAVWEPFTAWQLRTIDEIIVACKQKYPSIEWVTRHEDIDTRHWKSDIGPAYPLERATAALAGAPLIVPDMPETPPTALPRDLTPDIEPIGPVPHGEPAIGDAVMACTTGAINIRQQPRWFDECNVVKTLPKGMDIFIFPSRRYGEFTQCLYLDEDGKLMVGWAPTEYVEIE